MKIGRFCKVPGSWSAFVLIEPCWFRGMGWYAFNFAVFKLKQFPSDGWKFERGKHYKGFWIRFAFFIPFGRAG